MIYLARNIFWITFAGWIASCASYKQNIMFNTPEGFEPSNIALAANHALQDYLIQKNDYLTIEVFSNNGERLIDPNPELTTTNPAGNTQKEKVSYLVATDGEVKLPMVGNIKMEGYTLRQAETVIQKEYAKFFKDPYVAITFTNKRAVLLGSMGGQVIPLANQNMHLTEVLALGKGLDNSSKAHSIRVLRGEEVFLVDLSTVEGYRTGNILIQPGDIIYVEPVRRPASEALRDYGSLLSILVSLASLAVVIISVN